MLVCGIIIGVLGLYAVSATSCYVEKKKEILKLRQELAVYHARERAEEEIHKKKGEQDDC